MDESARCADRTSQRDVTTFEMNAERYQASNFCPGE